MSIEQLIFKVSSSVSAKDLFEIESGMVGIEAVMTILHDML